MLQAGLIVAGWDAQKGGSVWGIPLGGTLLEQPFTIGMPPACLTLPFEPLYIMSTLAVCVKR